MSQVLAPLKKGAAGTFELNKRLKQRLNPSIGDAAQLGVSVGDQAQHMHMHVRLQVATQPPPACTNTHTHNHAQTSTCNV